MILEETAAQAAGWSVQQGAFEASFYLSGLAEGLPNRARRLCGRAGTPQAYSWRDHAMAWPCGTD